MSSEEYCKLQKFRAMDTFIKYEAVGPASIFDAEKRDAVSEYWYLPDRSNTYSLDMDCLSFSMCIPDEHFYSWIEGWKPTFVTKSNDFY